MFCGTEERVGKMGMEWKKLLDGRSILPPGTILDLGQEGGHYRIAGEPVGYGGSGIIYPAVRVTRAAGDTKAAGDLKAAGDPGVPDDEKSLDRWEEDQMRVAVKECYPLVRGAALARKDNGEIIGEGADLYDHARRMLKKERSTTAQIYKKGFRLIPIWNIAEREKISLDGGEHFESAGNLYGIMERLDEKGVSLGQVLREKEEGRSAFRAYTAIVLIGQVLRALKEVHEAGFLHGDIQENNIFLKGGDLERPEQGEVSLLDFGAARPLLADGATEAIADRSLYTTNGYTAPECLRRNDGTLRLTRAADIYSVGYLLLRMLTGKAMDPKALQLVVNGRYIYGRQAKRIGCPLSSLEALNKILKKALDPDPAARYQTAEEMLTEVSRTERALAPKNSAIASVDYAAFISYCHEEKSMEAAEQIQRMIESYKIPRSLRPGEGEKGAKRLGKVFRDREELSSSGDMEAHIKEALDHSAFLIVLLCPDTPASVWVSREVELFLKTHSREQVLTVVVEGDPRETLPELLRKDEKEGQGGLKLQPVEGLAADIRGADKRERRKKLKTEIYRLLAPMLGCGYDDLRQRQREYQLKKVVRTMTAAIVSLSLIAGYIGWQAYQIHENYWETMLQRSRYLAQISSRLLKEGDRMGAIAVAMEALPDGEGDHSKPWAGEAEAALSQALYSYRATRARSDFMRGDRLLSMDERSKGMEQVSPDGRWLLALDENGTVYLWDIQSGVCEKKWDLPFWKEQGLSGEIVYCGFLDQDRVLLLAGTTLASVDIQSQKIQKVRELDYGENYPIEAVRCKLSEDGSLLAILQPSALWEFLMEKGPYPLLEVYRTSDGEQVYAEPMHEEIREMFSPGVGDMVFSPDGRYVAAMVYAAMGTSFYMEGAERIGGMLFLADLKEGSCETFINMERGYQNACFLSNGNVVVSGYTIPIEYDMLETIMPGVVECYDPGTGERVWEVPMDFQKRKGQGSGLQDMVMPDGQEVLLAWCNRDILSLDPATGEEIWHYTCEEGVTGISLWTDRYILGTEEGRLLSLDMERNAIFPLGTNVRRETERFFYDEQAYAGFLISAGDDRGDIVLLKDIRDDPKTVVRADGQIQSFSMRADGSYYAVTEADEGDKKKILIYDSDGHSQKASIAAGVWIKDYTWTRDGVFVYFQQMAMGEDLHEIVAYDVDAQKEVWKIQIEEDVVQTQSCTLEGGQDGLLVQYREKVEVIDLQDGAVAARAALSEEETGIGGLRIQEAQISPSGRYLFLVVDEGWLGVGWTVQLRAIDLTRDQEIRLPERYREMTLSNDMAGFLYMAQKKDMAAIYEEEAMQLSILDLEKMEIIQEIPFGGKDERQVCFLPDDRWLLLWGDDHYLKLWDLEQARIKMEDEQKVADISQIQVNEKIPFIEIYGVDSEQQEYSYGIINRESLLYRWEEDGRFYPYVKLTEASAVVDGAGISCLDAEGALCWYDPYTLDDLLEKGKEVLGDYTLDETARVRYLMEE